jgi:hypothetical protein
VLQQGRFWKCPYVQNFRIQNEDRFSLHIDLCLRDIDQLQWVGHSRSLRARGVVLEARPGWHVL